MFLVRDDAEKFQHEVALAAGQTHGLLAASSVVRVRSDKVGWVGF